MLFSTKNEEKAFNHMIKWTNFLEKRRTSTARKRVPTLYLLIGKSYMDKRDFADAEEYFERGLKAIENTPSGAQPIPKDDVYFQLQFSLLQALAEQKKKPEVLKLIPKLTSNFAAKEPLEQATLNESLAVKLFDMDEYEESLRHLDIALIILGKVESSSSGREDISSRVYDAQARRSAVLSALGRYDEAKEIMTSIAKRIRGVPPAAVSKYLTTTSSYVHKGEENFVKFEAEISHENTLPVGSFVVVKFETEENSIEEVHSVTEGARSIIVSSPPMGQVNEDKYYLIDATIYKDSTRSEILGVHYQLARVHSEPEGLSREEVQRRIMQSLLAGELE
eukprot:TRINITY_DN1666_c0_g2_i2.p1 TRINITY_DN1666_c0_g2~~TRINITY_DN1666_c0_g2_i2.p1  ORF type:complete len:336 (-),score=79.30 TRINITY_DN1666_c0_g2_i2:13-1020(-)